MFRIVVQIFHKLRSNGRVQVQTIIQFNFTIFLYQIVYEKDMHLRQVWLFIYNIDLQGHENGWTVRCGLLVILVHLQHYLSSSVHCCHFYLWLRYRKFGRVSRDRQWWIGVM